MRYGFQENSVNISSTKKSRIIFPVLLTINLTFLLSDNNLIYQFFLYHAYSVKMEDTLVISILLFPFLFILSFGIFSAIWCLEDSGISYSNDKAFKGKKKNIQAQNVGNWFDFLLKGYSGIGVIISYISQIFKSSEVTFLMLFLILFPVLLMILSLPVVFLFDSSKKRRNLFMHKIAHKQNIFEIFTVNVEYTEREEGI
ncbi:MAG: hypothetical protein JW891_17925 [Candidatus Lokiarchaeota archaeon]|nr:hypothetical protein [Candidatus Lokiarchaeota archaeon]